MSWLEEGEEKTVWRRDSVAAGGVTNETEVEPGEGRSLGDGRVFKPAGKACQRSRQRREGGVHVPSISDSFGFNGVTSMPRCWSESCCRTAGARTSARLLRVQGEAPRTFDGFVDAPATAKCEDVLQRPAQHFRMRFSDAMGSQEAVERLAGHCGRSRGGCSQFEVPKRATSSVHNRRRREAGVTGGGSARSAIQVPPSLSSALDFALLTLQLSSCHHPRRDDGDVSFGGGTMTVNTLQPAGSPTKSSPGEALNVDPVLLAIMDENRIVQLTHAPLFTFTPSSDPTSLLPIIAACDLGQFHRHPASEKIYRGQFRTTVMKRYGPMEVYLRQRLGWLEEDASDTVADEETGEQEYFRASDREGTSYKVARNEWPYALPPDVTYVLPHGSCCSRS